MYTILLIILVLLLVGALPTWPYSTGWGYYPSGGLGLVSLARRPRSMVALGNKWIWVLIIVLVLVLMGRV